jgi:putative peptidoglycan lipid II flippase
MTLFRSGIIVAGNTFISRIFGYVRDVLIASHLGTSHLADIFTVAWRLPNFFRTVFAEGAFSSAFIPIFSSKVQSEGQKKAFQFASLILTVLFICLFIFVFIFEMVMPFFMLIMAPGFIDEPEKFSLATKAARITFPYILFISICSLCTGILNSLNRFVAGSIMPVILSCSMIICLLYLEKYTKSHVIALSFGVLIAGVIQLAGILVACKNAGIKIGFTAPKINDDVKLLFRKMIPALIASSVVQLNFWFDTVIATTIGGAVSKLYYAERLNQFPLAIIGTAIGTVILPMLSKEIKQQNYETVNKTFEKALIASLVFAIPASIGLITTGKLMITVLFERGAFTNQDTIAVTLALKMLAIGLPAFILIKVLTPFYFAKLDTKTPLRISVVCLTLNVIFCLIFIRFFSHAGIALATSTSAWINVALLKYYLTKDNNFQANYRRIILNILRILFCALLMASLIVALEHSLIDLIYSDGKLGKALALLIMIALGGAAYLLSIFYLDVADRSILHRFKK